MPTSNDRPANVVAITSPDMFTDLMQQDLERVTLLNFWAPWAQPCEQMNQAVLEFAARYPKVLFMNVEAEEQPDVAESFDVEAVPTVVLLRGHTLLAKTSGCNVAAVAEALALHARDGSVRGADGLSHTNAAPQPAPRTYAAAGGAAAAVPAADDTRLHELPAGLNVDGESPQDTERRCRELMNRSKVMLFMKGHPGMPRCGFSQKTVALLRDQGVEFDHYDILSDENVRQTLKRINDWPTFPQIIVNGELIGGLDILKVRGRLARALTARNRSPPASLPTSSAVHRSRDRRAARRVLVHDAADGRAGGRAADRPDVHVVPCGEDRGAAERAAGDGPRGERRGRREAAERHGAARLHGVPRYARGHHPRHAGRAARRGVCAHGAQRTSRWCAYARKSLRTGLRGSCSTAKCTWAAHADAAAR